MTPEEVTMLVIKGILSIKSLTMFKIVFKYLNKKALGMQTILDHTIKDFIRISIMNLVTSWFVLVKFGITYAKPLAYGIVATNYFSVTAYFWQIFVTLAIRYLSIFHSSVLDDIEDHRVIQWSRSFVGMAALVSTLVENFQHGTIFAFLTNQEDSDIKTKNVTNSLKFILVIDIITLILVQIKIEILNLQEEYPKDIEKVTTEKVTIRGVCLSICVAMVVLVNWVFKRQTENEYAYLEEFRIRLFSQFICCNLIPMLLIFRHPKLLSFCLKQFKLF